MNKTVTAERKFVAKDVDERAVNDIVQVCGLRPLTARLLVGRGISTPQEAREFLTPSLERDWLDPSLIPGLLDVADVVEAAIRANERILIFGDFDVDGITATTISVRGLRELGATVDGLIPHRYNEGYALSPAAIERGMAFEPDLIVTVDCGISCGVEVQDVLARGVRVSVTDHHEPGENVPQGIALADPKLEQDCPSRDLAGAGVALKLIQVLGARFGKPALWRDLTDFAALGTVADLMRLRGENRALVTDGIARINNNPRACFAALSGVCGVRDEQITSTRLSFSFIPRINAAGRMGDATVALDLLMSDDPQQAAELAARLEETNQQRREVEAELADLVEEQLAEEFHDEPIIVAAGEGWHEGVKGIVASRIARKYQRPAIVFGIEDGTARGSGRTYGKLNLFDLVSEASNLLEKFGGHAAAVGITLPADRLDELRSVLERAMREHEPLERLEGTEVDTVAELSECDVEGFTELDRLHPFGNSNPVPTLAVQDVFLERRGAVGKQGNHFRYAATDGRESVAGIYFNVDNIDELVSCDRACDIVFEPSVDEWQGRYTAKLMTREIQVHPAVPAQPATEISERIDELFERADEICDTGEYAGITQAARFNTKVVGVTFENRQDALSQLETGVELKLVRQPNNEFDGNAIAVTLLDGTQLGFLNRLLAKRLAPVMDEGVEYNAAVSAVTGGPQSGETRDVRSPGSLGVRDPGVVDRSYGVNIVVRRVDLDMHEQRDEQARQQRLELARGQWKDVPAAELHDKLREALIGQHSLHEAQSKTLANLQRGISTLTIMATGRGKSLIFHLHAARIALAQGKASIFVYPLRALVADQAYHLQETFSRFGLTCCVLTGETDEQDRVRIYDEISQGAVHIVLTTPEFLSIHVERFAATRRIGFVVVDEAHHVGLSKAGNRPAYAELGRALDALGNPLVLAVTATAGDAEARLICSTLGIREVVVDPTVRANLHIDDQRDMRCREDYLASLAAGGAKCIAYVNSRDQSIKLTRMLRHRLPNLAPTIAFYNAGLSKEDRKRIETAFREGILRVIVATSAFGEGIDIPDVEHVVLFHLPFNDIEFNQMSGRAGRNGADAHVHLLYGYGDARINENILGSSAPTRDQMVALYKALRERARKAAEEGEADFSVTNAELSDRAAKIDRKSKIDESGVSCGISVFRELGFLETSGKSVARRIRMVPGPAHMELADSVRYREGTEEIADFAAFKKWALGADAQELLDRFNRPIVPEHPDQLISS